MTNFLFSNVDTIELATKYGTPLYVVSEDLIVDRCKEIKKDYIQKFKNTMVAYASKAFLTKEMARIIKREGFGMDVVSGGELYTAIQVDFPMEKIIFHGNNKTREEIEMAVQNGVGRIVVDNFLELKLIEEIAEKYNKKMNILFRITPGINSHTHRYIQTGQIDSKFGIPLDKEIIYKFINTAMNSQYVDLKGFHFHIGSQIHENTAHVKAINILVKLAKTAKEDLGFITREINAGGGYGIRYGQGECRKPISYYTDAMMKELIDGCEKYGLERPMLIIEPGRWIVGEAGITLYTIGSIKEIPGVRTYVGIDGGMPDNPRPALYGAKYEGVIANKIDKKPIQNVTIAGKCCETGDILIWDLNVPQIETGDILAVLSTGAYNYSMASNYNRIPKPAVVMLREGKDRLIVKRETYDDILKNEI
ncbi:MAG: diaminopimelate decarboxylase [Sporanaerobacter sp.]|jgi:diaminopimelate decarboxylase|uniref:diaminopimelate decarboxylase n=1 Tax=Sporanaerobacter sp. TaxID=2010183 RepID=UPI003A0FC9CE